MSEVVLIVYYTAEVMYMRQKELFKICHGCGQEIFNGHWKAKIGDSSITIKVLFHHKCYEHYKKVHPYDVKWAEEVR